MVLVDSSVWIELFRRNGDLLTSLALENLIEEMQATLCGFIKLEVLGGARGVERVTIANLFTLIPYLPQTESFWDEAVKFQWLARQKGITVPWSDALLATLARKNNCRVYAKDKHFEALAAVGLVSLYIPGTGGRYKAP